MNPIFENRHSVKSFTDQPVEKEKVDEVVKAGLLAPSGKNSQNGVIVCITNKEVIQKLENLNGKIGGFPKEVHPFYNASTVLLVMVKKCNTGIYDGSIMMENMLLCASDLGLGACWIHRAKEEVESTEGKEILSSLNLPLDEYEGIGHVVLGYPAVKGVKKEIKPGRVYYID